MRSTEAATRVRASSSMVCGGRRQEKVVGGGCVRKQRLPARTTQDMRTTRKARDPCVASAGRRDAGARDPLYPAARIMRHASQPALIARRAARGDRDRPAGSAQVTWRGYVSRGRETGQERSGAGGAAQHGASVWAPQAACASSPRQALPPSGRECDSSPSQPAPPLPLLCPA